MSCRSYVGTVIDSAMVFGFDYSQPSSPRLVSQAQYSGVVDSLVTGFAFVANNIYVAGATDAGTLIGADNTLPRNSINPFYPPLALATTSGSPGSQRRPLVRLLEGRAKSAGLKPMGLWEQAPFRSRRRGRATQILVMP